LNQPANSSPGNPYAAPAVVVDNAPLHAPDKSLARYNTVRTGFRIIYYSIATVVLGFVGLLLIGMISAFANFGMGMIFLGLLFYLILIGCIIATFAGLVMCFFAPEPNEKKKITISFVTGILSIIVSIMVGVAFSTYSPDSSLTYITGQYITFFSQILSVVSAAFFILFCKQIGSNVGSKSLKQSSVSALRWYIATAICSLVLLGIPLAINIGAGGLNGASLSSLTMGIFGLIIFVVAIGSLFSFLSMIRNGITSLTVNSKSI